MSHLCSPSQPPEKHTSKLAERGRGGGETLWQGPPTRCQWVLGVPEAHVINLRPHTQTHAHHPWVISAHICTPAPGGRKLFSAGWPRSGASFLPPPRTPCQAGLGKRSHLQGVSKPRWHVDVAGSSALGSLPPHIAPPARKAATVLFFPPFFLLFSSFSSSPPQKLLVAREKRGSLFVLMVVPFLRFILKKHKSSRERLTTGMMLNAHLGQHYFFCLRSSFCHFSFNSYSTDWHVCGTESLGLITTWQRSIYSTCIVRSFP